MTEIERYRNEIMPYLKSRRKRLCESMLESAVRGDERRRLRERVRALTVHTTIEGSGMDAKVVHCYTAGDITAIFGDTP